MSSIFPLFLPDSMYQTLNLFVYLSLFNYLYQSVYLLIRLSFLTLSEFHLSILYLFRYLTGLPVEGRYTVRLIVTDNHGKAFAPLKVYGEPTRSCCLDVPAKVDLYSIYIRHDQY